VGRILLDAVSETILNFVFFLLKFLAWGIQWSVALVIFIVVMAASAYYVYTVTLQAGEPVQVPNVVNLPMEEALIRLAEQGLEPGKQEPAPHETVPKGHIISQRPTPGRVVRTGRKVYLTYSMGKDYAKAIDVTNQPLDDAQSSLESSGFRVGTVSRVPDSKPRNLILAQDPPPGSSLEKGGSIHLLVSEGDGRNQSYMPDLRGKSVTEAEAIMAPFRVALSGQTVEMVGAREGVILDQDPQPDTLITEGQPVTYKIVPYKTTIRHEMRYDWYNRDVRIEQADRNGNQTVLETFPASTDENARATRVVGTKLAIPVQYIDKCTIHIYADNAVVASYAIKDGEAPAAITPR
jgi:beta-lactam-binding protein with PASTA domain